MTQLNAATIDNITNVLYAQGCSHYDGNIQICVKTSKGFKVAAQCRASNLQATLANLQMYDRCDYYITKNMMSGRSTHNLFALANIVIDIDSHAAIPSNDDINDLQDYVMSIPYLPTPTAITRSGRGIHMWWHVEPFGLKTDDYTQFDGGRSVMLQMVTCALQQDERFGNFSVDAAASSNDRGLIRLPGSHNTKCGIDQRVELSIMHPQPYTAWDMYCLEMQMAELYPEQYGDDDNDNNNNVSQPASSASEAPAKKSERDQSEAMLCKHRMEQLNQLCAIRGYKMTGCRNVMLTIYYNTALIGYSQSDAAGMTEALNDKLSDPLSDLELDRICRVHSTYHYTNDRICGILKISEREKNAIKMHPSSANRYHAKQAKNDRNQKIIELGLTGKSASAIAAQMDLNRATVDKVLKEANVKERYQSIIIADIRSGMSGRAAAKKYINSLMISAVNSGISIYF
jgi:DNA-binding NarL/FixJ family response regulator